MARYNIILRFKPLEFEFDTDDHEDFEQAEAGKHEAGEASLDPMDKDVVHDFIQDFISDNSAQDIANDDPSIDTITVEPTITPIAPPTPPAPKKP